MVKHESKATANLPGDERNCEDGGPLPLPFNLERGCAFTVGLFSNRISLMLKPLVDWFFLH